MFERQALDSGRRQTRVVQAEAPYFDPRSHRVLRSAIDRIASARHIKASLLLVITSTTPTSNYSYSTPSEVSLLFAPPLVLIKAVVSDLPLDFAPKDPATSDPTSAIGLPRAVTLLGDLIGVLHPHGSHDQVFRCHLKRLDPTRVDHHHIPLYTLDTLRPQYSASTRTITHLALSTLATPTPLAVAPAIPPAPPPC